MPVILCLLAILAAPAVEDTESPAAPLPLQPLTVELLDLMRGQWRFDDALGQHLSLQRPVTAFAWPGEAPEDLRLGWLLCDPEFPEDLTHATLRTVAPSEGARSVRIDEPFFSAQASIDWVGDAARCTLSDIRLGPATTGDRYVTALYLIADGRPVLLWLTPGADATELEPRLLTDRVGGVFVGDEPVRVTLVSGRGDGERFTLRASDYDTGEELHGQTVRLDGANRPASATVELPLQRFGIFRLVATAEDGAEATLRVCRIPEPIAIDPDRSTIGINLFQQQIWWYAHQAPMMARAGVRWIRPWLAWENAWSTQEPEPGAWDTRALDAALRRMDSLGQRYQAMLWSVPTWLTGGTVNGAPPLSAMDEWAAYVGRLVSRYRDRIDTWEVWNEPDLMWPEESRHGGEHYAAMLRASYLAAKVADPDCTVLGLSHAGYEQWLRSFAGLDAGRWFDIATLHTYAPPSGFALAIERRLQLLDDVGMGDKPIWVNEFGSVAYDESEGYSERFQCSERQQAERLTALYAQALAVGPGAKAFWFCTYDPRDPAHEDQWTGDAGIGVLYLGFVPKLSYAALAGVARQLDGRQPFGAVRLTPSRTQISFEGGMSVVWDERREPGKPVPATDLGCLPGESLIVRDLYTNEMARGAAREVLVDLARGPVYVEGSAQMGAIARCEQGLRLPIAPLSLHPGDTRDLALRVPAGAAVVIEPSAGLPVSSTVDGGALRVRAWRHAPRVSGKLTVRATFPPGAFGLLGTYVAQRSIPITTGAPNLVRDGGFDLGDVGEWTPERESPFAWDGEVGRAAPGSLRLDGSFDRRLVHWNVEPAAGKDWRLTGWVRTDGLAGCLATLSLAFFDEGGWLGSWCLARTDSDGPSQDWPTVDAPGRIPLGTADWTRVEATLSADRVPPDATRAALFVDVSGGSGSLWLDDLDLCQP